MGDGADVEILLKWKEENAAAHAEVMAKLVQISAAQTALNTATAASGAAAGVAIPGFLGIAAAAAVAIGVLSPFVALVGGAAVVMATFAATAAATAALLGGLGFGFGALGAGVMALGLSQGGIADARNEFQELTRDLDKMRVVLEKQAAPIAATIAQFAGQAIPYIQQLGQAILTWFGDRIIGVLVSVKTIITDLMPTFELFGKFVGKALDQAFGMTSIGPGGSIKTLAQSFEDGVRLMLGAVQGLISNLLALENWFLVRLPSFGAITRQALDVLGASVLWLAGTWGKFADWLGENWPAITALAARAIKSISDQWAIMGPQFQDFITRYGPALAAQLQYVAQNAGAVVPAIIAVIQVVGILSLGFLGMIGFAEALIIKIRDLTAKLLEFNNAARNSPLGFFLGNVGGSGGGSGGGGSSTPAYAHPGGRGYGPSTMNAVFNIRGEADPEATARAVSRQMRGLLAI